MIKQVGIAATGLAFVFVLWIMFPSLPNVLSQALLTLWTHN